MKHVCARRCKMSVQHDKSRVGKELTVRACFLSVGRLSVTFMHLTQPVEIFGNVSTPFATTFAIL